MHVLLVQATPCRPCQPPYLAMEPRREVLGRRPPREQIASAIKPGARFGLTGRHLPHALDSADFNPQRTPLATGQRRIVHGRAAPVHVQHSAGTRAGAPRRNPSGMRRR